MFWCDGLIVTFFLAFLVVSFFSLAGFAMMSMCCDLASGRGGAGERSARAGVAGSNDY